jgi:hypothetical protein
MFEPSYAYPMFKPTKPTPHLNKAGKNARQVQIRECFPQPLKERLDEGREMRRGKENAFGDQYFFSFSSKTKKAEDGLRCVLSEGNTLFRPRWYDLIAGPSPRSARRPIGIAAFVACPLYLGPGKRWQQQKGRGPCSASAPFLVNGAAGSASTKKDRIHLR